MNVDRALLTKSIQTGAVVQLISRGVSAHQFTQTPDGEELADVLNWMVDHTRRYNVAPSMSLFRQRWPEFRMEPSADPLDALIDAFFANVKRRHFAAKVKELAHAEYDPSKWLKLDEIMLDAAKDLAAIVPTGRVSRFSEMNKRVDRYELEVANPELQSAFKMGIKPFDDATGGFRPGNLVTIAGYSGRGKSLLSQFFLMQARESHDALGLLISLEMTADEIFERLDTMVTNFSHKLLAQRQLPEDKVDLWRRIAKQFQSSRSDIIVKDNLLGCTTDTVYAEISRYKPDIVAVDYVQLMRSKQNYAAQWQVLCDITNDLKQIALSTGTVILMVSQDGRDSAKNGSTEENMGSSVSILQAADIYLGLNQTDEMYKDRRMEIRMLKNRRGPKETRAYMDWDPNTMTFKYHDEAKPQSESFLREVS